MLCPTNKTLQKPPRSELAAKTSEMGRLHLASQQLAEDLRAGLAQVTHFLCIKCFRGPLGRRCAHAKSALRLTYCVAPAWFPAGQGAQVQGRLTFKATLGPATLPLLSAACCQTRSLWDKGRPPPGRLEQFPLPPCHPAPRPRCCRRPAAAWRPLTRRCTRWNRQAATGGGASLSFHCRVLSRGVGAWCLPTRPLTCHVIT